MYRVDIKIKKKLATEDDLPESRTMIENETINLDYLKSKKVEQVSLNKEKKILKKV